MYVTGNEVVNQDSDVPRTNAILGHVTRCTSQNVYKTAGRSTYLRFNFARRALNDIDGVPAELPSPSAPPAALEGKRLRELELPVGTVGQATRSASYRPTGGQLDGYSVLSPVRAPVAGMGMAALVWRPLADPDEASRCASRAAAAAAAACLAALRAARRSCRWLAAARRISRRSRSHDSSPAWAMVACWGLYSPNGSSAFISSSVNAKFLKHMGHS